MTSDEFSLTREKRSLSIHGHQTSISLEPEFWAIIDVAAKANKQSVSGLIAKQDDIRTASKTSYGLAAYLRLWALHYSKNNSRH